MYKKYNKPYIYLLISMIFSLDLVLYTNNHHHRHLVE